LRDLLILVFGAGDRVDAPQIAELKAEAAQADNEDKDAARSGRS
jgi:hypothetical protein